jgi:hypothetical protein
MFWIFKFTPDFVWYLLPILGLVSLGLSRVPVLYMYRTVLSIAGTVVLALGLYTLGMLYANNAWQQAAQELQAKVAAAEAQSQVVNEVVREKLVTQTKIVKQRGETVVKYIDREVVKLDERCTIPPEFVNAHNKAATR